MRCKGIDRVFDIVNPARGRVWIKAPACPSDRSLLKRSDVSTIVMMTIMVSSLSYRRASAGSRCSTIIPAILDPTPRPYR
jgi:hypothetical protein